MSQNLSAQIVCLNPKVWDFDEKGFIGRPQSVLQTKGRQEIAKIAKPEKRLIARTFF